MATTAPLSAPVEGTRFFTIMAFAMSTIIIAGFTVQVAMGRSSFSAPLAYHVHGMIFMGWIALYLTQHVLIATGQRTLHASIGKLAYIWIPAMVAAGCLMVVISIRSASGGPFFFAQNEFLISNAAVVITFGGVALWALRQRRYSGWHRRLMLVAMSMLTGPGLGRLLPLPLMIPHAWTVTVCLTFLFPIIGMIADKRTLGRVHPAYWWGLGIDIGAFALSMALAYSPLGYALTQWVVEGSPGAQRPMEAFMPPGFAM
ncbi:MAG: hypothetical protein V2I27_05120 [Erythrobacter sp.]|jgi:hypothetical protein|nr:hypothetical protein [Erythrobacter sp.]